MYVLGLLFGILYVMTNGQNVTRTCPIVSPNNPADVVAAGCVDGTTNFFYSTEPEMYLHERCICCQPGTDDNPPDNCALNDTLNSFEGQIICSENFDCCLCNKIICDDCKSVECGGDESCIGVDEVIINGSTSSGAGYICNGDVSCFATKVYGNQVTSCDCNGDWSCSNSSMWLNLDGEPIVTSLSLGFTGDNSGSYTTVEAHEVGGMMCAGDDSCNGSHMDLICDQTHGCLLSTNGDRSAIDSVWNVEFASGLTASGDDCIRNAVYNINMIQSGGPVTIGGDNGGINSTMNVTNCNSLRCGAEKTCYESTYNIHFIPNNKDNSVTIEGIDAAAYSTWNLKNPSSIGCTNLRACQGMTLDAECVGVGEGDTNGCNVQCKGMESCDNCTMSVKNVNGFSCTETNGCSNGWYNMECLDTGCDLTCSGACRNSIYILRNSKGLSCSGQINILNELGVVTAVEGTCENSEFWMNNNVGGHISCGSILACHNTTMLSDSPDGYIANIGPEGISCRGERVCYDSMIKGKCEDQIDGCPVTCEGALACGTENNPNHVIALKGSKSLTCIGGTIATESLSACGNRTFTLYPLQVSFSISCSGPYGCSHSEMNIFGDLAENIFGSTDTKCDSLSACEGSVMNYYPIAGQETKLAGKIGCSSDRSCAFLFINIFLKAITDGLSIDLWECASINSCISAGLNIYVYDPTAANGYRLTTEEEINSMSIGMACGEESFCPDAYINGFITFFSQANLNVNAPKPDTPKLINQLGTVWVIIIGILAIALIIVIRKNYQYRKIEKNMEQVVKDSKGKYSSPKNKSVKSPNNDDNNDDDIEIRYTNDQTKDVI